MAILAMLVHGRDARATIATRGASLASQWIGCRETKQKPLAARERRPYKASVCATRQYGWGNLLNITTTKCQVNQTNLSLNSSNPSSNQISGWSYDAAGNTLNTGAGTESYTWNAEERMATVASSLYGDDTYVYDGDGERVKKASGKVYWHGAGGEVLAESDLGGNVTAEYVFFDGERLARIDASGSVDYYLSDKLGSSAVVTDSGGNVLDDSDFLPFGDELDFASSSGNAYKYTGLERDADQLDHTLNRQYSSNFGRWMTPDPGGRKVVKLDDPQTWNMYAYVGNNPTSLNDPGGLQSNCANGPDGGGCSSNGESFEEDSMHFSDGRYGLEETITDLGIGMTKGLLNMLISAQKQWVDITYDMAVPAMTPATAKYIRGVLNAAGIKSARISATTNGKHAPHSWHYKGKAVDIHVVDGTRVIFYRSNPAERADVNAIQGAANDKRIGVAHENYGPAGLYKDGRQINNPGLQRQHENHIHLTVPDPWEN